MMQSTVMSISPALAKRFLTKNVTNRPLRPSVVRRYARQMSAGEWVLTHQGIAFDKQGNMLDGQHRCHAVIESGATVQMTVFSGADRSSFAFLDGGERRSLGDRLSIHPRVAETVRLAANIIHNPPSHDLCERVNVAIGRQADDLFRSCQSTAKVFSSAAMKLAAVVSIESGENREYVHSVYRNLVLGNLDDLPQIGKGLVRQALRGHLRVSDLGDVLARGLTVFDSRNASTERVQVKNPALAIERVREVVKGLL